MKDCFIVHNIDEDKAKADGTTMIKPVTSVALCAFSFILGILFFKYGRFLFIDRADITDESIDVFTLSSRINNLLNENSEKMAMILTKPICLSMLQLCTDVASITKGISLGIHNINYKEIIAERQRAIKDLDLAFDAKEDLNQFKNRLITTFNNCMKYLINIFAIVPCDGNPTIAIAKTAHEAKEFKTVVLSTAPNLFTRLCKLVGKLESELTET